MDQRELMFIILQFVHFFNWSTFQNPWYASNYEYNTKRKKENKRTLYKRWSDRLRDLEWENNKMNEESWMIVMIMMNFTS